MKLLSFVGTEGVLFSAFDFNALEMYMDVVFSLC